MTELIGLFLLFLSFYFGYSGKKWTWILFSLACGVVASTVFQTESVLFLFALTTAVPGLGFFVLIGFALAFGLHYALWWLGKRIKSRRG